MPTILRQDGFRFVIFVDDHEPAHLHVWYGGAIARIRIGDPNSPPRMVDPGSMRTPDARRAVRIVERRQGEFLNAWRRIHGA